jgi:hypothetical protein
MIQKCLDVAKRLWHRRVIFARSKLTLAYVDTLMLRWLRHAHGSTHTNHLLVLKDRAAWASLFASAPCSGEANNRGFQKRVNDFLRVIYQLHELKRFLV